MMQWSMPGIAMLVFFIVGCAFLGFGLFKLASNSIFWVQADSTEGKVVGAVELERDRNVASIQEDAPTLATVVRFTAADGKEYTHIPDVSSEAVIYEKGTMVRILYDAEDPTRAIIGDFYNMFLGPLLTAVFGGVFCIVGLMGLLFAKFLASQRRGGGRDPD